MESRNSGRRIRAYRKLKGYTQEEFARQIGMSVSLLGEVERGNRLASEPAIERMATVLNISKEELTV
ncbi:helix-turn-helix domain-containing protein [Halalkalibacter krulwichiae]|uniref:helix-turn-helix domain-containing protein n=1 Tax=Halalkalibacter krulwichiae TaxID=199441 RepID=UPI000A076CF2|nr:helix-turn-helix transcriptional regulator [Halalkalibacter krulwichiae]